MFDIVCFVLCIVGFIVAIIIMNSIYNSEGTKTYNTSIYILLYTVYVILGVSTGYFANKIWNI